VPQNFDGGQLERKSSDSSTWRERGRCLDQRIVRAGAPVSAKLYRGAYDGVLAEVLNVVVVGAFPVITPTAALRSRGQVVRRATARGSADMTL